MDDTTVVELFRERVSALGHRPALREKRAGRWQSTSWHQWYERSKAIAATMCERGLRPGDRVAIAGNTSLPWVVADLAVQLAGAVVVPIYPSASPSQAQFILDDAGARWVFVDSVFVDGVAQATGLFGGSAAIQVVTFNDIPRRDQAPNNFVALPELEAQGRNLLTDKTKAKALQDRREKLGPEDLATIVYSSGTTGQPKGVMLSHGNLVFEIRSITKALRIGPSDEQLLFLPLAHIFGRMLVFVQIGTGMITSFAESAFKALDNMAEVNPTIFASVPRLFEKIYALTSQSGNREGKAKQRLLRWAFDVGESFANAKLTGRRVGRAEALQYRYAKKIVLRRIRRTFGTRLRFAVSGGAPLSEQIAHWFYAANVLILEVYGLTECTGGATLNRLDQFRFGTVGPALPGVEVQVAKDGEVLIRGPNVMTGYWRQATATAEAVDHDRWLHTGDLGELSYGVAADDLPMLQITGRRKDLIVTAGGSNIAPSKLELLLERSPWINHAIVYGDGRPYLVSLLTLDEEAVRRWATDRNLDLEAVETLGQHPEVRGLVDTDIELLNGGLASYETIKKVAIVADQWSVESGELTDTLKVRRNLIVDQYGALLDELYEGAPVSGVFPRSATTGGRP